MESGKILKRNESLPAKKVNECNAKCGSPHADNIPLQITRRRPLNNHQIDTGFRVYHPGIILLLFIIISVPPVTAADTMFRANAEHTGVYDNGGIVPGNTELWRFATGGAVDSSPAVSNGVVYVGSDDHNLYAVDAGTGMQKWRFITGGAVRSSPAVSNGVVYAGSKDKNLYAIDAVTGMEKWRFATGGAMDSSPAVSNDIVYIYSSDHNLYAIDATTGFEKWRFLTGGDYSGFPFDPSPTVDNGIVYFGQTSNFHAIDAATGFEKWRFVVADIQGLNFGISSSAVDNGIAYIGGTYDQNLYAIDIVTGKEKFRFISGSAITSSPAVSDGVVYVGCRDTNLHAIDVVTGKEKWRFKTTLSEVFSSPAVGDGIVYVGSYKNLYAIDAVTGMEKWRFPIGDMIYSSPAVSNGVIFVGSKDGNLYAVGEQSSQVKSQTTLSAHTTIYPRTSAPNGAADPIDAPIITIWDRNNLIYLIILVFVLLFGALMYDTYYKKKK
jgi:eukaryotic-like serine/threonine-protein kinase